MATIEANRQETDKKQIKTDEKLTKITEDLKVFTETITSMMDQIKNFEIITRPERYIESSGPYHSGTG